MPHQLLSTYRGKATQFGEKWEFLGSSPKVVTTLREGYTLPFRFRLNLTRSPTVISNYQNPSKQAHPLEALYQLVNKNAVEPVANQNSLGYYNQLFLVPKPNNWWRLVLDLEHLEHLSKHRVIQNGDPRDNKDLPTVGGVGRIHRLERRILPIHSQSRKYMRFRIQDQSYQFKALPFGLSTVRATSHQTCLQHTQTFVALCRELGWLVNKKSELEPKQVFNFVGYQFDLREGKVRPTPDRWQTLQDKILSILSGVPGPAVHVPHRTSHSHRKASPLRLISHETHTVALEEQLEGTGITRKGDTRPQVTPPPLKVVAGGKQCASRSTITPSKTCSADIYRRIKRRVGRLLKRTHFKGKLVPSRKQVTHKPLGTKGGLSGPKRAPRPLFKQHSTGSHRQHNSGCLYQQRSGDEVCGESCPGAPGNR